MYLKKFQILSRFTTLSCLQFFVAFNIHAQTTNYEMCIKVAAEISKTFPIRKDDLTVLKSAVCTKGNPKNDIWYIHEVDINKEQIKFIDLQNLKPNIRNLWCSDPDLRYTLNAYNIGFRYYIKDGTYIRAFSLKSLECN